MATASSPAIPTPEPERLTAGAPTPLKAVHTTNFPSLLRELGASILVTTYQAGKLVLVRDEGDHLNTHFRAFQAPMGMALAGDRLALDTKIQVREFLLHQGSDNTMIANKPGDQRRSGRETAEARRPHRRRMRPILLPLEERTLLSTFTVNNPTDTPVAGQTDLREAIDEANAATSASTIDFNIATPATITLFNGELELSNTSYATTMDGPGAALLNVSGNNASRVFQIDGGVTASLSGMTIKGGRASNGGGLANDGGTAVLVKCTVTGNSASNAGGGLYDNSGTTTLTNCTVSGNSASYGGGGLGNDSGTTTLTNCTVSGNSASYGGGFYNRGGTAILTNCTVSGNSGYGGGLYNNYGGTATLTNTIVAGNLSGGDIGGGGGYAGTNNLIGGNPQLAPLGSYGGPTQTMALLPGSPAIDAGTSTGAPTTDQRGDGRVGAVDIGAFESSGFTIAVTSGSGQSASAAFSDPLVATVTANNPNEPVTGGLVTFTPPASGASATIQGSPAVISGDGTAKVTAASNFIGGSYTVSATSDGLAGAGSFSLTNYAVVSIEVSPGNPSLAVSVAGQFTATGTFTNGSTQDMTNAVTWSSATPSFATIGGTGVATGIAPGTSAITASWQGIASPDETLTVIARSFVVNTTDDAFGFYHGTTSLREAIAGGNAVPGQAITFDSTVFNTAMTITLSGTQLELSNTTGIETITGPAAGVTVSGNHSSRVFQVDGGVTVSLSGMTITGGSASNGGGLANDGGTATLTNCTVSGNIAAGNGGGLYNKSGTTALTNCTVSGNSASNGGGAFTGGVYNYYGSNYSGTTALTNCTVSGNSASDGGGGLLTSSYGTTTLANTTVSGNFAYFGGGLFTGGYYSTTTLNNCTVSGNSAAGSGGGGLVLNSGTATLTNCTVSGNSADNDGGGLYNRGGTATLTNCTVSGNSAGFGGGLDSFVSTTTLTNCTVIGNTASFGGGGLVNNSGTATLTNCTVSGNSAGNKGGGLYEFDGSFSTLNIGNTIVAGNTAGTSRPDAIGTFSSLGNNLIGATDSSSGWVGSDLTGTNAQPLHPVLAPAGNYGGPTQTMALLPGSPALGAGNNLLAVDAQGDPLTTDQRGFNRIVNGTVDIGAFESSGFTIKVTSGSGQSTGVLTAFPTPLVAKVTAKNPLEPVAGGLVTFTPPASGASATLSQATLSQAVISAAGTASATATANGVVGNYTVSVSASGISKPLRFNLTNYQLIIALDPSAPGTLSLSGNAGINIVGVVYVDSSSSSALLASGNAKVKATAIDVHGGVRKQGTVSLSPAPVTRAPVLAVASLPLPSSTGMTNYGSFSLSGNSSKTIQPGIYSSISISGNAKLTMVGGIYIIEGGGFSMAGNASVTGSAVMIVNAGSDYPGTGGSYGNISLGSRGSCNLFPMMSGPYAGIVFFQPGDNRRELTVTGNASGIRGTTYAPGAALSESQNGSINGSLLVDTITISGNGVIGLDPLGKLSPSAAVVDPTTLNASDGPIPMTIKVIGALSKTVRSSSLPVVSMSAVGPFGTLVPQAAPGSFRPDSLFTFDGTNRFKITRRTEFIPYRFPAVI